MTLREQFIETLMSILGVKNSYKRDILRLQNELLELTADMNSVKSIVSALIMANPNMKLINTRSNAYDSDEEDEDYDEQDDDDDKRNLN